jgi:hypothetical protein
VALFDKCIDCREPKSFALIVREPDERCERFMMFTVPEDIELEKTSKMTVVEFFAKQLAHSMTRVDYVSPNVS